MTVARAALGGVSGLIASTHSTAQSDSAHELVKMREQLRRHLLTSFAISNPAEQAIASLREVRREASEAGWDGYNAEPLDPGAYYFGHLFLNALPTTSPPPEISADPDGEISFDWLFGDRKALTVSIGPTGRCTYAWMLGQRKNRGTEWFEDEIPASIVFALGQLSQSSPTKRPK